jgi:hypothetical protein
MNADILVPLIPITALMIPIVAILVKHQQSMAQILHGGAAENERIAALSEEIRQLRQRVDSLTLSLDSRQMSAQPAVRQRLGGGPDQ